jgi:hypothetical protein
MTRKNLVRVAHAALTSVSVLAGCGDNTAASSASSSTTQIPTSVDEAPAVKELVQQIITAQEAEIRQTRDLLA